MQAVTERTSVPVSSSPEKAVAQAQPVVLSPASGKIDAAEPIAASADGQGIPAATALPAVSLGREAVVPPTTSAEAPQPTVAPQQKPPQALPVNAPVGEDVPALFVEPGAGRAGTDRTAQQSTTPEPTLPDTETFDGAVALAQLVPDAAVTQNPASMVVVQTQQPTLQSQQAAVAATDPAEDSTATASPRGSARPARRNDPAPSPASAAVPAARAAIAPTEMPEGMVDRVTDSASTFTTQAAAATQAPQAEQPANPLPRPDTGFAVPTPQLQQKPVADLPPADALSRQGPTGAELAKPEADIAVSTRSLEGLNEVEVRLTPAELGRIDVRLSIPEKGRLEAVVAADNPAALEILRREGADLARALASASPSSDGASLSFQSRTPDEQSGRRGQARPRSTTAARAEEAPAEWRPMATSGRIERIA